MMILIVDEDIMLRLSTISARMANVVPFNKF